MDVMTPMTWYNTIAGALLVFLIILLASAIMDRQKHSKPYRMPSSEGQRGLKPEIVFPNSKTVETFSPLLDNPKGIVTRGESL